LEEEIREAPGDLFEGFAGRRVSVERYRVVSDQRPT
jgi:hypothetical protein